MGPPAVAVVVGQASVTAIAGAVVTVQRVEMTCDTASWVQVSLPVPVKVVVTVQALAGTTVVLVKLADAPGARVPIVNTVVFAAGRSLSTVTLTNVMLPVLRTVPV